MSFGLQKITQVINPIQIWKLQRMQGLTKTKYFLVKKKKDNNTWLCRFILQSILIRSPLMWGRCTHKPPWVFAAPLPPPATPCAAPARVHHGRGDRVTEKHYWCCYQPGRTPAGFHYRQQKERLSSQSDKHSRCVG